MQFFQRVRYVFLIAMIGTFTILITIACDSAQQTDEVTGVEAEETVDTVTSPPIVVDVTSVVTDEIVNKPSPTPTQVEPVTHYGAPSGAAYTFDPQRATDVYSNNYNENLFVHLTNFDSASAEVLPEAATAWDISDDGLIYAFDIRTDIPWVTHNPDTGETIQVVDDDGNPRFVTAHDFVYSIKRACHPEHGSQAGSVIAPLIKGCEDLLFIENIEDVSAEVCDAVGVSALSDDKLIIELAEPAGFFLSMTPLSVLAATPQWTIEAYGDDWATPGRIVTSGNYMLEEYVPDIRNVLRRNPLMPADMQGSGNIELFVSNVVEDINTAYALWEKVKLNNLASQRGDSEAHITSYPDEIV